MSVPSVRPARPDDAAAIARLRIDTWRAAYAGIVDADVLGGLGVDDADIERRQQRIREPPPGVHTLVATADGEVVGFVVVGPTRDDGGAELTGEVYAIYVDAAHWGTGIGRQLMAAGLGRLTDEGFRRVTLWVLEGNARARGFYEAAGMTADGQRKLLEMPGETPEIRYAGPL
jgi:ribosomal protein S18 acetylase RimI-like enzyme